MPLVIKSAPFSDESVWPITAHPRRIVVHQALQFVDQNALAQLLDARASVTEDHVVRAVCLRILLTRSSIGLPVAVRPRSVTNRRHDRAVPRFRLNVFAGRRARWMNRTSRWRPTRTAPISAFHSISSGTCRRLFAFAVSRPSRRISPYSCRTPSVIDNAAMD